MDEKTKVFLKEKRDEAFRHTVETIHAYGSGHVGGALSILDVLVVLYFHLMRVDPQKPRWPARDRLVVSKGHAAPAVYTLLAMKNYFGMDLLKTLNQNGTLLPSHCDMKKVPGVDMTAGSLGQGLSAAVGMAIACRLDNMDNTVYAIIGDGECQEGEIWEAALLAQQLRLDNLVVFLDNNGGQVDGYTRNIINVEPLDKKWDAFNWDVARIDGHDHAAIAGAVAAAKDKVGKPHLIINDTVKAKGFVGLEGTEKCHYAPIDEETKQALLDSLHGGTKDG